MTSIIPKLIGVKEMSECPVVLRVVVPSAGRKFVRKELLRKQKPREKMLVLLAPYPR